MGVDNQAEHWVWVLHMQGDFQGVVDMSHMAEDKAVLQGTGQEEGNHLGNLAGTDLGDMADGTPGLQQLGTVVRWVGMGIVGVEEEPGWGVQAGKQEEVECQDNSERLEV